MHFFIALTFLIKRNESKVDRGNGHIDDKTPIDPIRTEPSPTPFPSLNKCCIFIIIF